MPRKVFLSFLGATNYGLCDYQKDGISYGINRFIQISTLKYIGADKWGKNDAAYFFITEESKNKNWVDNGQTDYNGNTITQDGLESELSKLNLPISIKPVFNVSIGNNEEEIWEIFEIIYNIIQNNDELYIDLTHGFRYFSTLMIVLGNYAKFLKNTNVKSVTYGNYEISEKGKKPGLIVDLLPITTLQDWSFASGSFLKYGNIEYLVELSKNEINPILKDTKGTDKTAISLRKIVDTLEKIVKERITCRGISIIKSEEISKINKLLDENTSVVIAPLEPIIEKIKKSLAFFDAQYNIRNAYVAAKWCYENKLYQQSASLLQEFVVSFLCSRNNIEIADENKREIINQAFTLKSDGKDKDVDNNWEKVKDENKAQLSVVINDGLLDSIELLNCFSDLTKLRNDYMHSGMRSKTKPLDPDAIIKNIEKHISTIGKILFGAPTNNSQTPSSTLPSLFINLTNHPSADWAEEQKNAALLYGDIRDMDFPAVEPDATEQDVRLLAEQTVEPIIELAKEHSVTVHIMGEMTLTCSIVSKLKQCGIRCVASTTFRDAHTDEQGNKVSVFRFVQFREY